MDYLITTDNLTKQFKKNKAVDCLNIHVKRGSIYGFIGRNGAGKTTTLKMLSGLTAPTSGDFYFMGKNHNEIIAEHLFAKVGLLIEEPGLYMDMSAYNNLKMKCLCAGISSDTYIKELLEIVGLSDVGKKPVKYYSMGMKQRLGIAIALIGDPELLILDEPINGLDPQGIFEVRETILRLNRERGLTIIISSHILEELAKIATNYGIINKGVLLTELSAQELADRCESRIVIHVADEAGAQKVFAEQGITQYKVVAPGVFHIYERLNDSAQIGMALAKADVLVSSLNVESTTLEEYFFNLTGGVGND